MKRSEAARTETSIRVTAESQKPFAESFLAKARKYCKALVVKDWEKFDDKLNPGKVLM